MSDVVFISGSPSATSRTATVLAALAAKIGEGGLRTAQIQVRELPAADLASATAQDARTQEALRLVAGARAVVVGTPIYKASLTGMLKAFLDLLPHEALKGKVALPVGTGAAAAHSLTIEHSLAPLLFALGADAVVRGQYFIDTDLAEGKLSPAAAQAVESAATRLLSFGGTR
jgi:FMN reductase